MKKIYIKTYGCQMNIYDSSRMNDVMVANDYSKTDNPNDADLIILNTCHIREKAAEKVYSELGRLRDMRAKSGKNSLIAVAGCVAQAEGAEIINRAPFVDMVIGSGAYHHLPRLIHEAEKKSGNVVELEFPETPKFDLLPKNIGVNGKNAFLSVQEGCDKFCSFCVVPYTRGMEYSRNVSNIMEEAKQLVSKGVIEITLLGQNVNAFHGIDKAGKTASLADLIAKLAQIEGLENIRYITSHPKDMQQDLIDAHGEITKLAPYLHLPIQSGSNKILKKMNRQHTTSFYMNIIEKLRSVRPDIAFSSDFIVGFPDESETDFEDTIKVAKTVSYASAYSFIYSPRAGTPAASHVQIPKEISEERLDRLQNVLSNSQKNFNQSCIGKIMKILPDRIGKLENQVIGRSPYMQAVHIKGAKLNEPVTVKIIAETGSSLRGRII